MSLMSADSYVLSFSPAVSSAVAWYLVSAASLLIQSLRRMTSHLWSSYMSRSPCHMTLLSSSLAVVGVPLSLSAWVPYRMFLFGCSFAGSVRISSLVGANGGISLVTGGGLASGPMLYLRCCTKALAVANWSFLRFSACASFFASSITLSAICLSLSWPRMLPMNQEVRSSLVFLFVFESAHSFWWGVSSEGTLSSSSFSKGKMRFHCSFSGTVYSMVYLPRGPRCCLPPPGV